jgi:hypothetical protein
MARMDVDQINKNRRTMADSTIEGPYVPTFEDSETDIPQMLYGDNMPADRVGLMPSNERERSKR